MKLSQTAPFHPPGSRKLRSRPRDEEIISVTVVLRPASSVESRKNRIHEFGTRLPAARKHFGSKDFERQHGAKKKDLERIEAFAVKNGLDIVESSRTRRCVVLSGKIAAFRNAFAVEFALHRHDGQTYRSHQNQIQVSPDLAGIIQAVLGLENRPLMTHHAFAKAAKETHHTTPSDVAKAYHFPAKASGKTQRIAIVELGGGFYQSDLEAYFKKLNLNIPKITAIELDGQRNDPSTKEEIHEILIAMGVTEEATQQTTMDSASLTKALWTIEATLDIELAGAFANEAEIVVYFAPNNSQGKYHALTTALHSKEHPPTIISCSWGAVEENLSDDFIHAMDQVFQDAALRGVTICFSSGDKGDDPDKNGIPRVHFPASSPNVLSCGGTHWSSSETQPREVVWSEKMPTYTAQTGGGVSKLFEIPSWQTSADVAAKTKMSGRGVPDVAGKADMTSGYEMIVGGYSVTMGGTSSAVPMWAGLIARLNEELGKSIGYLTPLLYDSKFADAVTDITEGNNGPHYCAEPGWDACTGVGTPNGIKLLAALRGKTGQLA